MLSSVLVTLAMCLAVSIAGEVPVTCGSAVTLQNKDSKFYLHSHGIAWGSGSGQQSVTAHDSVSGPGNMWQVKSGHRKPMCEASQAIACGDRVRLEHVQTGRLLHSHLFKAPLSGNQEVSCFGDGGEGDTGDDWIVECDAGATHWIRGQPVTLRHADTGKVLSTSKTAMFNQQNCGGGCPIMGQTEVSASQYSDNKSKWMTSQGVYFQSKDAKFAGTYDDDDEL